MTVELIYFANPMCSWCWGFAPALRGLLDRHGTALHVTVAVGALGRGDAPMTPGDKAEVRGHWEHVQARTGQPFDFAFFDRDGFVYDTEPASRALMVVRAKSTAMALPYLHALHRAFYAENRDITALPELRRLAEQCGVDGDAFAAAFAAPASREAVALEQAETARLGVTGYPTLIGLARGRAQVLSLGCRPLADVEAALQPLLEAGAGPAGP